MTAPRRVSQESGAALRGARDDAMSPRAATDLATYLVTCPLCGARYREEDGRTCRARCPLERGCRLLRCPECRYEVPAPSRLTRALARWFGVAERSA